MKLYLVTRTDDVEYDEYDARVVAAHDEEDARTMLVDAVDCGYGAWVKLQQVDSLRVEYLGDTAHSRGIVLDSFTADY